MITDDYQPIGPCNNNRIGFNCLVSDFNIVKKLIGSNFSEKKLTDDYCLHLVLVANVGASGEGVKDSWGVDLSRRIGVLPFRVSHNPLKVNY